MGIPPLVSQDDIEMKQENKYQRQSQTAKSNRWPTAGIRTWFALYICSFHSKLIFLWAPALAPFLINFGDWPTVCWIGNSLDILRMNLFTLEWTNSMFPFQNGYPFLRKTNPKMKLQMAFPKMAACWASHTILFRIPTRSNTSHLRNAQPRSLSMG